MTPAMRRAVIARDLFAAVQPALERAIAVGEAVMAALLATPRGPARAVEAALWAKRLVEGEHEHIAVVFRPESSDDHVDAHAELLYALHREREETR